jgi:hypothetical protein
MTSAGSYGTLITEVTRGRSRHRQGVEEDR